MVGLLVGLKLTLLRNGARRSTWRLIALIIGAVYALAIVAASWAGLTALRFADAGIAGAVTVIAFGLLTLGWLLMSLLLFGTDETVDPARFALLPVPAAKLQPGLFLAGLLGIPGVATTLVTLGLLASWSRGPAMVISILLVIPIGVGTCFLLARTGTAAFSRALSSRRFKDVAAVILALFGASIGVSINAIIAGAEQTSPDDLLALLHRTAAVVGWTPIGWVWSVPAALAAGAPVLAVIKYILGAGFVAGLWLAWRHFLAESLTSPLESTSGGREIAGHNLIDRLYPASPVGAIAGRALRYYRRDPRYLAALAALAMLPVIIVVLGVMNGSTSTPINAFAPAFLALLIGSMVTNDISYDGSAFWTHVSAGISGAADRAGRSLATATVTTPVLVAFIVATQLFTGRFELLPHVLAVVIILTLAGLGVGCWAGTVWQVPVPPPGANPFQRNNSGGMASMASMFANIGMTLICALPTFIVLVLSVWFGWLAYVAIGVAVITGVIVLRAGIRFGGERLDHRMPEVLTRVSARQ